MGLSRTVIDNKDLQWSAIGKIQCVNPGDRDPKWVDADLNYGIDNRFAIENIITKFNIFCKPRAINQTRHAYHFKTCKTLGLHFLHVLKADRWAVLSAVL